MPSMETLTVSPSWMADPLGRAGSRDGRRAAGSSLIHSMMAPCRGSSARSGYVGALTVDLGADLQVRWVGSVTIRPDRAETYRAPWRVHWPSALCWSRAETSWRWCIKDVSGLAQPHRCRGRRSPP